MSNASSVLEDLLKIDMAPAQGWRRSLPFAGHRLGLYPARNAIVRLDRGAETIWDFLAEKPDISAAIEQYRRTYPDRAATAIHDVAACIGAWLENGFLRAPTAREERRDAKTCLPSWVYELAFIAGSVTILLRTDSHELGLALRDCLAFFEAAEKQDGPIIEIKTDGTDKARLVVDGETRQTDVSLAYARSLVVANIVRLAAGTTPWIAQIHAAAVSNGQASALLMGPSGVGKTTLTVSLLAGGWKLLAEDLTPFDKESQVHPLPFAPSVKRGAWALLANYWPDLLAQHTHMLDARALRYLPLRPKMMAERPLKPSAIVKLQYAPSRCPAIEPLGPMQRLGLMLNDESYLDLGSDHVSDFFAFIEETPGYAISYSNSEQAMLLLDHCLEKVKHKADCRAKRHANKSGIWGSYCVEYSPWTDMQE